MNELINSLSNRDLSIIFWSSVSVLFLIFNDLKSVKHFFALLLNKYLIVLYIFVSLYFGFIIIYLTKLNIWEISYYKELIFWIVTTGIVLFYKLNELNRLIDFIKIILEALTITTFLEYVINLESFSLITELILVPLIFFLSIIFQISSYKNQSSPKYKTVTKLLEFILALFGFFILGFTFYNIINDFNKYFNYGNFKTFLISPFLTLIFTPILYFIIVYMKYETNFGVLDRYKFLNKRRNLRIKLYFILICNINLKKLDSMKEMIIWNKSQLKDETKIFHFIKKNIDKVEKNYDDL
ncbi:hypothetical protein LNP04_03365 [Chryseobacterium sp. C-71]|uniref:hypothetical protein n=1 Tax=Chryseobacterium sp. C-71 TaxID=2893882 RepID=UPI001E32FD86|nr:hypothetical protein [Chryseobacterium sp. C-71]UFH32771.1 hypothetical protein LNP04_03365 [Chryseobacterium sp. C-71]